MSSAYCVGVRIETAMSLVTWSPAMGITAVWRMAPLANTARSVVPPPMSTRHTPSSFSSSVRTAKLEASCSSTTSSTLRPQRWMHFSMFCAAESAPVTMCTLASSRTPDMPIGSRMPSWPSTMNSCGSTCRIFWSAGMATALAASMTCSTSPWLTSLSRTPTTPCELRLRTWLPAMSANTEWISQPAISSASSTARWIDCTVDSILTTTPFFRPREGCEPSPSSSIEPSRPTSPTSATTLEVPMSRPTIRLRSVRLSIVTTFAVRGVAAPADCKTVCVPHVHVSDVLGALADELQRGIHESLEALIHLAAPEAHRHAVGEVELPGAARIEAHGAQTQPRLHQAPFRGQVALRHQRLLAGWPLELRELGRDVVRIGIEELAAGVEQAALAPARRRGLLDHQHREPARPGALDAHRIDPRQGVDGAAHRGEIHRQEPRVVQLRLHHALHVHRGDALEAPLHRHRLDRLIERPHHACGGERGERDERRGDAERAIVESRQPQAAPRLARLAAVAGAALEHLQPLPAAGVARRRVKLVSSTRQTSSAKSMPTARAAIGTRLWLVMPGTVLTSSSSGRPLASIMKSARPQPLAPTASKAPSARLARCASALADKPDGQK